MNSRGLENSVFFFSPDMNVVTLTATASKSFQRVLMKMLGMVNASVVCFSSFPKRVSYG